MDAGTAALGGEQSIAISYWRAADDEPPELTKAAKNYDARATFDGGRFTGQVLLGSPRERSVSCHTPVAAALDLVAIDSFEVDE